MGRCTSGVVGEFACGLHKGLYEGRMLMLSLFSRMNPFMSAEG